MRSPVLLLAAIAALAGCDGAPAEPPLPSPPPPPAVPGRWLASTVRDARLPAAIYVFTDSVDGRAVSAHFIVDSAVIELQSDGRYEHHIWYSEWHGAAGGPPVELRFRYHHGDFGEWLLDETTLRTTSGWFQNHRMAAELAGAGRELRFQHGLTPGDEVVPISYQR